MRGLATFFSILLLAWMIAGVPLQFVKVRTLAQAIEAGDVPPVYAHFDPNRVDEFVEDFGDRGYDESDYNEIEYNEDLFEDTIDEESLENSRVYKEIYGKIFRIVPASEK